MRTARSRISGENFGDFLILAPFSSEGASSKPGAVHPNEQFCKLGLSFLTAIRPDHQPARFNRAGTL
jgi:hypothetical protein